MGKIKKTNALRILDQAKIKYKVFEYNSSDGLIDGLSVAKKVAKDPRLVFKTLVAQGNSRELYVFIIPVTEVLDLKKAAALTKEKRIEMIPVKNLFKSTGYVKGGCSPIGMKKRYKTYLDSSADTLRLITVSGGKIGLQIELPVVNLLELVGGKLGDLAK